MKRSLVLLCIASLIISACNVPVSGESAEAIQTYAAQTVEAAILNSSNNTTPLASPTSASTSASGDASATFEDVTNCRTGPGVNYERITQIQPNESVEVIGFFPPNYWVVNSKDGPCWVSGEFVTPAGNMAVVPTVTAPPTPQGGKLENVSIRNYNNSCDYVTNQTNIYIEWADKDGETGYRIYRNDELVAELSADTTTFGESITLLAGQSVGYYIVAFNGLGETRSNNISMYC